MIFDILVKVLSMIKKMIKKVIGQNNITAVKQNVRFLRDKRYLKSHCQIECMESGVLYQKFKQDGKHVFFGYYDIQQFDKIERRMLVHVVGEKASPKFASAELGYYDVINNTYTHFTTTSAWCWQQGARLRWHPIENDKVIFNDVESGAYICKVMDLKSKKICKQYCCALYDIDSLATYGLSLNFSRLQRLRPGYGYGVLKDDTIDNKAPEGDGIFYVDLRNNTKRLIVSLKELAAQVSDPLADQHYINHISISPNGTKFMFFHIWTLVGDTHWRTRLCVYSITDGTMQIIEETDRVSHYDWKSDNELLVTCWGKDKKQYYCLYDLSRKRKCILKDKRLMHDGHPSTLKDESIFVSDTYPLDNDMQTLFKYDLLKEEYTQVMKVYSDPRLFDEKRCDLHPRVSNSEKYITIDSTCENECRQVLLIRNWRR